VLANDVVIDVIAAGFPLARALTGGLAAWTNAYGTDYLFPVPAAIDYGDSVPALAGPFLEPVHLHSALFALVDLRTPDEYSAQHLIGATNIPIDEFDVESLSQWLGDLPADAEIIVYDQTGAESDAIAQALIAAGYTRAKSLLGGLDEWARIYGDQLIWADDS